jgi:succinyl-diaminopimelate desuccinylase
VPHKKWGPTVNTSNQIFSQIDQQLSAWVDAHRDELIDKTQRLLQVPSVKGEPAPGAPFGIETRRALDLALGFAAEHGLTIKNLDGYAGHAEWVAEGVAPEAEIVGVLAHVDVVPEGDGWTHPPFGGEIADGKVYGRGAIDDKGPAMAGLFGMLAVKECGVPLGKRLRMILGADEESGFGCVKHYFAREEMPATGFTPDGMFPLVYAEKGIANVTLTRPAPAEGERIHVISLNGGRRSNMVPDFAEAILHQHDAPWAAMRSRLESVIGVKTEQLDGERLRVTARGVSAHGSTPEQGINAVVLLCDALLLLDHQEDQVQMIERICAWGQDTTGGALGIAGADDVAGPLTSNLGVASLDDGTLSLTFNIRYPVTWTVDTLRTRLEPILAETRFSIGEITDQGPLYVPQDDPLVETLLSVYRAETGDESPAKTIGGGTYARAMTHGVAFGPDFPGTPGVAHQADENWPVDQLVLAAKIYAKALARLANG